MRKAALYLLGVLASLTLAYSCASIGTPSGGPRDEDPPKFVTSTPLQGEVEVTPKKVTLVFNELVTLKDAFSKVVVSPPSKQPPRVSSQGRRVNVEFRDSLLPNTTYTIDFGDAIADNNEGNQLENFIYTFSTGPVLDTLMVSGMVLGAQDLAPESGIYVGLHSNPADSAFTKTRFERVAKTDDNGKFVIGGLAPGKYRIYALEDRDNDMAWSSPDETLAFYDMLIEPSAETTVATDTIFDLFTGKVDSIVQRQRTRFVPNNILLRSYNTGFRQQYISKYERPDSSRINIILNAPADSMPKLELVMPDAPSISFAEIAVTERSRTNDTISFWLRDREIMGRDTLRVAIQYLKADSAFNMVPVNDTLRLITKKEVEKPAKVSNKSKEEAEEAEPEIPTIALKALISRPEVNQPLLLEVPVPLETFDFDKVHLEFKKDSVWNPVANLTAEALVFDTLNPRRFRIDYPWEYETQYKLTVDSLAGKSIYDVFTDALNLEFAIRPESEYGSIRLNLSNYGDPATPRFVELLDGSGKKVASEMLDKRSVTFKYLLPGKYNVRVFEDFNANGEWDPGNFQLGIPPDIAYYYPITIDLKANWDQEIDWNVFSTPVDKMVPETLRKKK